VVVNRSGEATARVTLPADFTGHQVGRDFVLRVRRDAHGVEAILEYRLARREDRPPGDARYAGSSRMVRFRLLKTQMSAAMSSARSTI
jgi:hypothetical protein